jgi:hypothetical protein
MTPTPKLCLSGYVLCAERKRNQSTNPYSFFTNVKQVDPSLLVFFTNLEMLRICYLIAATFTVPTIIC